jgi:hypothetical protein
VGRTLSDSATITVRTSQALFRHGRCVVCKSAHLLMRLGRRPFGSIEAHDYVAGDSTLLRHVTDVDVLDDLHASAANVYSCTPEIFRDGTSCAFSLLSALNMLSILVNSRQMALLEVVDAWIRKRWKIQGGRDELFRQSIERVSIWYA